MRISILLLLYPDVNYILVYGKMKLEVMKTTVQSLFHFCEFYQAMKNKSI